MKQVSEAFEPVPDTSVVYRRPRPGGGPAAVFVHGWACRSADWDPVVDHLSNLDAILVDLPLHGSSTSTRKAWDVPSHGEVVAALVEHLDVTGPVLIGHSMGGAVSLEAAARLDGIPLVLGVDSLTYAGVYPKQTEAAVAAGTAALRTDFGEGMAALVAGLFTDPSRDELIAQITAEMSASPPEPTIHLLEELLRWDLAAALGATSVPVETICAARLLTDEGRSALAGRATVTALDLGGHFYLREDPAGTAAAIASRLAAHGVIERFE